MMNHKSDQRLQVLLEHVRQHLSVYCMEPPKVDEDDGGVMFNWVRLHAESRLEVRETLPTLPKRCRGIIEYVVGTDVHTPGSCDEPPSVEYVETLRTKDLAEAIGKVFAMLAQQEAQNVLEIEGIKERIDLDRDVSDDVAHTLQQLP